MSNYHINKMAARSKAGGPSLTDQAAARETDINVIVGRMLPSGVIPGLKGPGIYVDWTGVPIDLRGLFDQARGLAKLRDKLPEQIKHLSVQQLVGLTDQQLVSILTPPKQDDKPETKP